MTRKRFVKLLMSQGIQRNQAQAIVRLVHFVKMMEGIKTPLSLPSPAKSGVPVKNGSVVSEASFLKRVAMCT